MTPEERQALTSALNAIQSTSAALGLVAARLEAVERAIVSLHRRLQLQEAGTALYEVANGIPREAH